MTEEVEVPNVLVLNVKIVEQHRSECGQLPRRNSYPIKTPTADEHVYVGYNKPTLVVF